MKTVLEMRYFEVDFARSRDTNSSMFVVLPWLYPVYCFLRLTLPLQSVSLHQMRQRSSINPASADYGQTSSRV
jgi:hypothetical protein